MSDVMRLLMRMAAESPESYDLLERLVREGDDEMDPEAQEHASQLLAAARRRAAMRVID